MQNIKSPLNYTGGKFRLLPQIQPLFPKQISVFYDLFFGGGNVSINIQAKKIIANDINKNLVDLFKFFKLHSNDLILNQVESIIKDYQLSNTIDYSYESYGCNSSDGLGSYNTDPYNKLKSNYNSSSYDKYHKEIMLYVLIIYGFNNQIRFNKSGGYNIPVGKRDFNLQAKNNLLTFLNRLKTLQIFFSSVEFNLVKLSNIQKDDFFYIDPPYLITTATYNESNSWNLKKEKELLDFLDNLNNKNIKFALSNVIEHKTKKNDTLIDWCHKNKFNVHLLNFSYNNSSYQAKNTDGKTQEVLITNY